jgi:exonuclease SbcD
MKFLLVGDVHLTEKTPENRADNYPEIQKGKMKFILDIAMRHDATILQAGDLFDTPKSSYELFHTTLKLFKDQSVKIFTVAGQHDLRYHANIINTPIYAMFVAQGIAILDSKPIPIIKTSPMYLSIYLYGSSFGEKIPNIEVEGSNKFNILVTHRMVIGNKKVWPGQEEFEHGRHLLRKTKFDLIVTGDNHESFTDEYNDRILVNPGSVMRNSVSQIDKQPMIYLFDTTKRKLTEIEIPIQPGKKVFKIEKIQREKERDIKLEAFVEGLGEYTGVGLDFKSNLFKYIKKNKIRDGTKPIIEEAFEVLNYRRGHGKD